MDVLTFQGKIKKVMSKYEKDLGKNSEAFKNGEDYQPLLDTLKNILDESNEILNKVRLDDDFKSTFKQSFFGKMLERFNEFGGKDDNSKEFLDKFNKLIKSYL